VIWPLIFWWLWLAVGLAERPDVTPTPPPRMPVPSTHRLSDGTPVWVLPRLGLPLVRIELTLRTGWLDAPDPLAAKMAGTLLDEGAGRWSGAEWSQALESLGAQAALGVTALRAWADVEALSGTEAAAISLLAEAVLDPALARRDVRQRRRRWVRGQRDGWRSGRAVHHAALTRAIYPPDHPLGAITSTRQMRRLSVRRVRAAWRGLLQRGSPALLVAGDTTAERILPVLEAAWAGRLPGTLKHGSLPRPPPAGPELILVDHPGSAQAQITLSLPAPGAGTPELRAAERVGHVLAGAFTSRLVTTLRERMGLAYGVESTLRAWPGHGRLEISTAVAPEAVALALDAIHGELWAMQLRPPDAEETAGSVASALREAAASRARPAALAHRYGQLQLLGRPPTAARDDLAEVAALTPAALTEAVAMLLDTDDVVWVVLGDRPRCEPALEAGGWPPDRIWSGRALVR